MADFHVPPLAGRHSALNEVERIALFLPNLETGGAETVFIMLSREFSRLGYDTDLVVASAEGPLLPRISEGVNLFDLKADAGRGGTLRFITVATTGLARYLARRRPAALLSTLTGTNHIATCARQMSGIPVRLVLREAVTLRNRPGSLRQRLIPWVYPHADQIVAVSRGVADDLAGTGIQADKIRVIRNPVDIDTLELLSCDPPEESLIIIDDRPIILGLGRLEPQKDFHTLLLAFSRLRMHSALRLVILGDGSLRAELQGLARELGIHRDTEIPGNVLNPFPFLRRASVFALSSVWEGYPNSLVEALALNKPVVATDCHSGPAEILALSGCGKLVPPRDADAMSRAIEKSLGLKGFCRPSDAFFASHSLDNVARQYLRSLCLLA